LLWWHLGDEEDKMYQERLAKTKWIGEMMRIRAEYHFNNWAIAWNPTVLPLMRDFSQCSKSCSNLLLHFLTPKELLTGIMDQPATPFLTWRSFLQGPMPLPPPKKHKNWWANV
jgi:hypothetical protein